MSAQPASTPIPQSGISLAQRAGRAFPLHTMLHGFALHANRQVDVRNCGPRFVEAVVRARDGDGPGRMENVRLEARSGRLVVGCSCPARSLGLATCKHTWALVLEADLRCMLDELRSTLRPLHVDAIDLSPPKESDHTGRHRDGGTKEEDQEDEEEEGGGEERAERHGGGGRRDEHR